MPTATKPEATEATPLDAVYVEPVAVIVEARSHLACALSQATSADDQIIIGHMRSALDLLRVLRTDAEATASRNTRGASLVAAIRTFTVEMAGGTMPNGETECAIERLGNALNAHDEGRARTAFGAMCRSLADDTQRLREAAEAYFGGDFRSEVSP